MYKKITPKNILNYIEGNSKKIVDKFDLLPNYEKEQVEWSANDCMINGKCKYCGCSVPGKLYVKKSCNDGKRFPDMMNDIEWELYKKDNNIKL